MKRMVLALFLIAVVISTFPVHAATEMQKFDFGNFTYKLPKSWIYDELNGVMNHYSGSDVLNGQYLMTQCNELHTGTDDKDTLEAYCEIYFDSYIEGVGSSFANIQYVDDPELSCSIIYPSQLFTAEYETGFEPLNIVGLMWADFTHFYTLTFSHFGKSIEVTKSEFCAITNTIEEKREQAPNSRKNPAHVGETLGIQVKENNITYTMQVTVEEFYRGDDYTNLVGDSGRKASEGCEYVAVKVSVLFKSIDAIDVNALGTDDPQISVDEVFNFDTYTADGSQYDNVHYTIRNQKKLTNVFEGANTTGYFEFEIMKDDPAPMLTYEPNYNQRVWISLK